MSYKNHLRAQLVQARQYSEGLLKAFQTPAEWLHQVHPKANHPLWFAGHMAVVDDFFIRLVAPDKGLPEPNFAELFGPGSQPSPKMDDYPPPADVLRYMRDRRQTLLAILDGLSEDDLNRPLPKAKGTPEFLRDWGSVFQMAAWHEGIHSGQVSVAHRALGHKPLAGG